MRRALLATAILGAVGGSSPARAEPSCGDLLIVYDRSGSMSNCEIDGMKKEAIAKKALSALFAKFPDVPMGLFVFPNTLTTCAMASACNVGRLVIDVAPDGAKKISEWLGSMPASCGGTPTGDTMQAVKGYDKWTPGLAHFVLVLTDGQPTCQDGFEGGMPVPDTSGGFLPKPPKCEGASPTVACDGKGSCECRNPTKVFDALREMFDKKIHTFVVGFEGMGKSSDPFGLGCGEGGKPFNPETLDRMADLGGEPSAGPTKYYSAVDEMTLLGALEKILGKVVKGGGTVGGGKCVSGGGGAGGTGKDGSAGMGGVGGGGGQGGGGAGGGGGSTANPGDRGAPGCLCALRSAGPDVAGPGGAVIAGALVVALALCRRRGRRCR